MSEQRRPLLLPQEVKALGSASALIFYEGLWPIRCRKIRYFQDARFRARLLPPPMVPPAPIETPAQVDSGGGGSIEPAGDAASGGEIRGVQKPLSREATMEDIDRLDSLTLEDFAAPLGEIEVPQKADGERLTAEEMNAAVEQFLQTLQR